MRYLKGDIAGKRILELGIGTIPLLSGNLSILASYRNPPLADYRRRAQAGYAGPRERTAFFFDPRDKVWLTNAKN